MNSKSTYFGNELFTSLCNRAPVSAELKFFDALTKSLPVQSTNMSSSVAIRNRLCQDNPNGKKFNDIYQQLYLINSKEVETYISLLDSIKKTPAIMEMLKYNEELENEAHRMNFSNSRLQKSIESIPTKFKELKKNKTSSVEYDTVQKNKYQTLDFIDLSDIPTCLKSFPDISLLDKISQENALIKDLSNCLMGCTGLYIRPMPLESRERQFSIDNTMYPQFLNLVKSILVVASHVSLISRFIDVYSSYKYGAVNQALATAFNYELREFRLLVCQMENLHRHGAPGEFTLAAMSNYVKEPGEKLRLMANVCGIIEQGKCRGGAILTHLNLLTLSVGASKQRILLKNLIQVASYPFFRTLKIWIFRGVIMDTFNEFFIKEDPKYQIKKSANMSEITVGPNFWANSYVIETHLVPRFLEVQVDKILNTGKYLNVIQLCGFDADFPVIEDMVYENDESYYLVQIDRAHEYASKLLLDIMFNKMRMREYFKFMKHYFLICEADWLGFFLELASDELSEKTADCQLSRLESLLDVAVQSRSSGNDMLKEKLKVELSAQELIPFIFHVVSFKPDQARVKKEIIGQNMRVIEAFTLNMTVDWPLSLLFHKEIRQRYQILFRHLFYCHHVARVLSSVWTLNKGGVSGLQVHSSDQNRLIIKARALGGRMRNFIMNLLYYMTTEVIEPFWNLFQARLELAKNIDEVFQLHESFIQVCLNNCMLSSKSMLKSLQKMMVLCVTYSNRINRLFNTGSDDGGADVKISIDNIDTNAFQEMIDQDDKNFTTIISTLISDINEFESENKKLVNLAERMEFNDNYVM